VTTIAFVGDDLVVTLDRALFRSSSQQLVQRDRQIPDALAGGVETGVGDGSRDADNTKESPSLNVTGSMGRPNVSAAICVIIVCVPVPMSAVALLVSGRPSAVNTAFALNSLYGTLVRRRDQESDALATNVTQRRRGMALRSEAEQAPN